ncbi:hypothetical protein [Geodermatophilus ruber]|uniref:DUF4878 domain-containing protein n=1 Tax=Geodermatophilus ruber TaxID=504800 RepID=A0A1I4E788_9ACTN|nr:hypothetical protein [Geodermatophilus ruber]SFL01694.1 hypothetical protein SAMN04488085_105283 [Geodermatophilus ruber]
MSTGPYLYDEGPTSLHTGTPRRRNGLLLALLGGTVAVGVGMVVTLPLVKGSPDEQAREVTGVFLEAMAQGDRETAHQLLCQEERARLAADAIAAEYTRPGTAEIAGIEAGERGDSPARLVEVRWTDGGTTATATFTVVNQDGPRVCGVSPAG